MRHARKQWTAWSTEHRCEGLAARSLCGVASQTYNPLYRERAKRGVRRVLSVLQGYLLVQIDRRDDRMVGEVARARGVVGVVGIVLDEEVAWLRGLEDEQGYVVIEEENPPVFAFGESVLALTGTFRDQRGEYRGVDPDNARRARVAYEIMGRMIESSVLRYSLAR